MNKKTGLADLENYREFCKQWRGYVLNEARKWCCSEEIQELLTEAVLTDFRVRFADEEPRENLGYYLSGQVCLIYSLTGQSSYRIRNYIAQHGARFADEKRTEPVSDAVIPEAQEKEPEEVIPLKTIRTTVSPRHFRMKKAHQRSAEPAPVEEKTESNLTADSTILSALTDQDGKKEKKHTEEEQKEEKKEPKEPEAQIQTDRLQRKETPKNERGAEKENEGSIPQPGIQQSNPNQVPDTYIDPNRTELWVPGEMTTTFVQQEISLPDESADEEEGSVRLSFFNTILFLGTVASCGFFIYETKVVQYIMSLL